jgi:hypothetical protein
MCSAHLTPHRNCLWPLFTLQVLFAHCKFTLQVRVSHCHTLSYTICRIGWNLHLTGVMATLLGQQGLGQQYVQGWLPATTAAPLWQPAKAQAGAELNHNHIHVCLFACTTLQVWLPATTAARLWQLVKVPTGAELNHNHTHVPMFVHTTPCAFRHP